MSKKRTFRSYSLYLYGFIHTNNIKHITLEIPDKTELLKGILTVSVPKISIKNTKIRKLFLSFPFAPVYDCSIEIN